MKPSNAEAPELPAGFMPGCTNWRSAHMIRIKKRSHMTGVEIG